MKPLVPMLEKGPQMSPKHEIAPILARDPRYTIEAYALVLQALDRATRQARSAQRRRTSKPAGSSKSRKAPGGPNHVTGEQLCHATRDLVLEQYGLLGIGLLARWGIHSTSDVGEIVYALIASGDLSKTDKDSRSDFDNVFDFETALRRDYRVVDPDESAGGTQAE